MKTANFRLGRKIIKLNFNYFESNTSNGFKRFFKDTEYWCDALVCDPTYENGSVLHCLEPDGEALKEICAEVNERGSIRTIKKERGEPNYILVNNRIFEELEVTIAFYKELGTILRTISDDLGGLETLRVTPFARTRFGNDELLAVMGYLSGLTDNAKDTSIKRCIFDCDDVLGEALCDALVEMGAETVDYETEPECIHRLLKAIGEGERKIVKEELAKGRALNQFNGYGNSPLFEALHVNDLKTVELLLEKGADINKQSPRGFSAVLYAARSANLEAVKMLVARGADLKAHTVRKENCLMFAAALGDTQMVHFLLKQGMDTKVRNVLGWSAARLAYESGHASLAKEIELVG